MVDTVIRWARQERGIQMAALARAANLTDSNLSRLETGKNKAGPSVRARLAAALAIPEGELFDNSGWPREVRNV
ncbi:MAG: hypothetical protein AMXMBFR33_02060 [Candidatus Xenobia bacterium]